LMKTVMRRNGGGNAATAPGRLSDLYCSPEFLFALKADKSKK